MMRMMMKNRDEVEHSPCSIHPSIPTLELPFKRQKPGAGPGSDRGGRDPPVVHVNTFVLLRQREDGDHPLRGKWGGGGGQRGAAGERARVDESPGSKSKLTRAGQRGEGTPPPTPLSGQAAHQEGAA